MRLRPTAAIAVLFAAGLALTGCAASNSTGSPTSTPTTAAAVAPADALAAAFGKLTGQGYDIKLRIVGGGTTATGQGSVDSAKRSAHLEETASIQGQAVQLAATAIDDKLWVKLNFGPLNAQAGVDPNKWMLVDKSKITSDTGTTFDLTGPDALDLAGLMKNVNNVTRTDATHLSGTVDLTAATGVTKPSGDDLSAIGNLAKAVPFTATVDDQDRLTELKVNPGGTGLALEVTISNYGSPSAITAPADSDVVPAPATVYTILNS